MSLGPNPTAMAQSKNCRSDFPRVTIVFAAVVFAHAILFGLIAWSEWADAAPNATAGVEIPVEMATLEEAEGRTKTKQSGDAAGTPAGAPAAVEPREADKPAASPPATAERPAERTQESAAGSATPPPGQIVERPQESDLPQAARTRGAKDKSPDNARPQEKHDEANPFGGLASVEKPAAPERMPTFLSPQSLMAQPARPRPAPDSTNDNYRAKVLGIVAANMIDPERPRPKALAIVGFRIDDKGGLESVWLARPTGSAELDAEAIDMVRRAAPFPAPPANADRNFGAAIAFGGD
ncbi:MAG: TonB family protein [Rhodoblastus sp.]